MAVSNVLSTNATHHLHQVPELVGNLENQRARIAVLEELLLQYRETQVMDRSHMNITLERIDNTASKARDKVKQLSHESTRKLEKLKDQLLKTTQYALADQSVLSSLQARLANATQSTCSAEGNEIKQDTSIEKMERDGQAMDMRLGDVRKTVDRLTHGMHRITGEFTEQTETLTELADNTAILLQLLPAVSNQQRSIASLLWQLPQDCDAAASHTGPALIRPVASHYATKVYCINDGETRWTVIQRRLNGSVNFSQGWADYRQGFGDPNGEFWLGNENLHHLTTQGDYALHIDMWDLEGTYMWAEYDYFKVDDETANFKLHIDGYKGNATDALAYSNRMPFSTQDRDNDASSTHCAKFYTAGWWYKHCHYGNLNGRYSLGVVWFNHERDEWIQLARVIMKIKLSRLHPDARRYDVPERDDLTDDIWSRLEEDEGSGRDSNRVH